MSKEGDRAAVFRTTKVRTKLKGDNSWMQRGSDAQADSNVEEKPWMAEVRASRLSSAQEPAPASPTPATAPIDRPVAGKGVFTKTESKPAATSTSNGLRASPAVVRPAAQKSSPPAPTEGQLSLEEQEKRTEAASSVLKKSSVKQRSYVFSAAKKFESTEKEPDPVNSSPSFVAKRVEITDDDEIAAPAATIPPTIPSVSPTPPPAPLPASPPAPLPASAPAPLPASPPDPLPAPLPTRRSAPLPVRVPPSPTVRLPARLPAPLPVPESTPQTLVKTSVDIVVVAEEVKVDEPVEEATPQGVPVKTDVPEAVATATGEDPEDMKPGCTKVDTPLPELILVPEVAAAPSRDLELSETKDAEPVELVAPERSAAAPVAQQIVLEESRVWETPSPNQTSSSGETLTTLSDTLISFDKHSTSLLDSQIKDDVPEPTSPLVKSLLVDESPLVPTSPVHEESAVQEPAPEISNCVVLTDDLLSLTGGPVELVEPVPPSPGRWSQDLLSGPESLSRPVDNSLDLLADSVIPINTEAHRSTADAEESKEEWDQKHTDIQSPTETFTTRTTDISTENYPASGSQVTTTTTTTTVVTSSSTDPFDPYPIGTTSPHSSSDLAPPLSAHSVNSSVTLVSNTSPEKGDLNTGFSEHTNALEALADDVIPIDTDTKSLSTRRSWARTWETNTSTDERQGDVPASRGEDQQTLVTFERKSLENDSPWDRWTSPTVVTVPSAEEEEEEEEEEEVELSPGGTETQTVTTITTVRETYSDPEPALDRSETYSSSVTQEESQRTETPEPKKPFVYVKEYTNATELSLLNGKGEIGSDSDYLTSSTSYSSYSSPTTYSSAALSSTCNYCGQLVGNDAKITIEHLNINCHSNCFKCGVCSRPMGDLLYSMFLHAGLVHCESCYSKALD